MTVVTVDLELPEALLESLHQSPAELQREVRLALAIDWYRRGLVSQGRAAEIAGLPRADFIDEISARKIDVFQVDIDELRREIRRD